MSQGDLFAAARAIAADVAEFKRAPRTDMDASGATAVAEARGATEVGDRFLVPGHGLLAEYDRRIVDTQLRTATRSRFVSEHYADAVKAGVKSLCDCIRAKSGSIEDGDSLMTIVFSPSKPVLRVNAGRTKNDESEQRGHMMICQGVVAAWRNPRAHSLIDDSPERALLMLEAIQHLMTTTKNATRTRKRKKA